MIRRVTFVLCMLWAGLIGPAQFGGAAQAEIRIAVVSGEPCATADTILAAVIPQLAAREGFVLLERAEIGRVLNEQGLARAGIQNSDQAIRIGQILHVDLFVVVRAEVLGDEPGVLQFVKVLIIEADAEGLHRLAHLT